jgi:hypothetical protein
MYKVTVNVTPVRRRYNSNPFLASALEGVGGQYHVPAALPPERPSACCTGVWVGLGSGMNRHRIPCRHWDSILGHSRP